jgi:hypothetical protein
MLCRQYAVLVLCLFCLALSCTAALAVNFSDVPSTYWAWSYIEGAREAGVVSGYGDGTYLPESVVTRDQMAVFVSRALAGGDANITTPTGTASFADVPTDYWAYKYVEYAKVNNIVAGYWDGYHPTEEVDRAQMAVYISRAIASPLGETGLADYTPPTTASFADVAIDYWAYKYIEYAKEQGVVQGYWDGYHPADAVTRAQMAVYICRAFDLATPTQPADIGNYFPVDEGDSWTYQKADGLAHVTTISGTTTVDSDTYQRFIEDTGDETYWKLDSDGLHLGGAVQVDGSTTHTVTYSPAFLIPRAVTPGVSGGATGTVTVDGTDSGSGTLTYTLLGTESVITAAGTFADCAKLEIEVTGPTATHFYLWLASGVGEVKQDKRPFGGSSFRELVAANVGGVSYPTDPYDVADYWPLAEGDTWAYARVGDTATSTQTVSGTITLGGTTYHRMVYGDGDVDDMLVDSTGMHLGGMYSSGSQFVLTPAFLIPGGLAPAETSGLQSSTVTVGGVSQGTATFEATSAAIETVTVAAGTFTYCARIDMAITFPGDTPKTISMWLAKGVGKVRQITVKSGEVTKTDELTSATVGGVSYP